MYTTELPIILLPLTPAARRDVPVAPMAWLVVGFLSGKCCFDN